MPYTPHLVQVTTDGQGIVTRMLDMLYLGAGVYAPEPLENRLPEPPDAEAGPVHVNWLEDMPGQTDYDTFQASSVEPMAWVMFTTEQPVKDFQVLHFIEQDGPDDGSTDFLIDSLYRQDELKPERGLAVSVSFFGAIPAYGVSYVDAGGMTHTFAITVNKEDGSVFLWAFGPPSPLGG